ncbi:MAG: hypothetical protein E7179_02795 [Erysipelotrichaceae bacterium]|nr:hypothetical protein [Erysipelotrichaceae bacterium]
MNNPFFELDCSDLEYPACKEEAIKRFGPPAIDRWDEALFFTHDGVLVRFRRCGSLGQDDEDGDPQGPRHVVILVHEGGRTYRFDSPDRVEFLLLREGETVTKGPRRPQLSARDWQSIYEQIAHNSLMSRLKLPKNRAERREIQRYLGNEGRRKLSLFFKACIRKDDEENVYLA